MEIDIDNNRCNKKLKIDKNDSNLIFPNTILKLILKNLIESNQTSNEEKLKISMVSWYFFESVKKIINNSLNHPIFIDIIDEEKESKYSLLDYGVKYLKIKHDAVFNENVRNENEELGYCSWHALSIPIKYDDNMDELINSKFLEKLSMVEILDIETNLNKNFFNCLSINGSGGNCFKNLKKLIITTTNQNGNQFKNQINQLIEKGIKVKLNLITGIKDCFKINFDKINGATVNIGQYVDKYYSKCISKVKHLKILYENELHDDDMSPDNSDEDPTLSNFILYNLNKSEKANSLERLKSLHLEFNFNEIIISDLEIQNLLKCFETANNLKKIIISFNGEEFVKSNYDEEEEDEEEDEEEEEEEEENIKKNHETIIKEIVKFVSRNPSFPNVEKIIVPFMVDNLFSFNKQSSFFNEDYGTMEYKLTRIINVTEIGN